MGIDNGANIDQAQANHTTPLVVALCNNQIEVAKFLLKKDANIENTKFVLKKYYNENFELNNILDKLCTLMEK